MSLEQTIGNLEIRYANVVTFVGSSNTMVDTTTGRIQTKGIQHNSNVITDVSGPHGRVAPTLKKYPEIAFAEGKFDENGLTLLPVQTQSGYTVSASKASTNFKQQWTVFDGLKGAAGANYMWRPYAYNGGNTQNYDTNGNYDPTTITAAGEPVSRLDTNTEQGEWISVEMPTAIKLKYFNIYSQWNSLGNIVDSGHLYAKNTSTDSWVNIHSFSGATTTSVEVPTIHNVNSTTSYKQFALIVTKSAGGQPTIGEWELYGTEENPPAGDHSVDTTFKSRFNNPQTTGVQVLVDGATGVGTNQISGGPDPSGNQATMTSPNKYWTLNGTLTSNLAVEANTFLEGDQPHAVSVWFNSSNLEANVSNTCVFSISDQEHLNSQNLDLQSNTWHNLTYAYQGEGGSRVAYLDGRKVSEDQAEDTFGDYPPFAMTGYSQGGYVVSASSDYLSDVNALRNAYKVYNATTDSAGVWMTDFGTFNPNAVGGNTFTDSDGGTHTGHWNKLELPSKLKPSYFYFRNSGTLTSSRNANNWVILGSNNDSSWDLLHSSTTVLNTTLSIPINSTKAYKYLIFLCKSVNADTALYMDEIRYYGHRENDLVRLPDPTNVLKYPHIAMTGPAQRGYVASASSKSADDYAPYKAFDNNTSGDNGWTASGTPYSTSNGSYAGGTTYQTTVTGHTPTAVNGEFLQLELTHKINPTKFRITSYTGNGSTGSGRQPKNGVFAGSNDGTNWVLLKSYTNQTSWTQGTFVEITPDTNTSTDYKYIRLIVTDVQSTTDGTVTIHGLEIYGTGVDSVPIQIGGGNIDKIANFRVYDKFIGEDQALEIWNAQKEEFGRAKPQMVLQQGKLGIGTDAPQGSLSVADEPHVPEEFPPRAMTGYKTYMEGHGEFCVSSTHESDPFDDTSIGLGKLFDKGLKPGMQSSHFYRGVDNVFDTNGYYTGSDSISGIMGDWVRIDFPYRAKIQSMNILTRSDHYNGRAPRDGYLLGKNSDEDVWTIVHKWTEALYYKFIERKFTIEASKYYSSYALVATRLLSAAETDTYSTSVTRLNMSEWRLFGTREQGQSVLHDGQLTLTKSLNVPRIGPALDADDTPRRDRLVVEYNTSTNPTFEGAVRDTSGRGVDGIMYTATYNASEKALESNGNTGTSNNGPGGSASGNLNDYGSFETVLPSSLQGNPVFTVSGWFKQNTIADLQLAWLVARNLRVTAQPGISNKMHWFGITSTGRPRIALGGGGNLNLYYTDGSIKAGSWHHMVVVIEPTGTDVTQNHVRFYLDGVHQTTSDTGSSGTIDLGDGAPPRMHWLWQESSTVYYDGSASNIKLHDTALTTEEVKTLYNMGRNGSVVNPQPLHIEAPLYAPGTIVQVQYASTPLNNTVRQLITGGELSDAANDVDYLDMTFKPKFANSSILLTAMINNTCTHVASFGFKEDGTIVRTQADNTNSTGGISTIYDGTSEQNRMYNINIQVMVPANGTHTRRYNVAANSYWADVNYNLYINDRNTINSMSSISNMVVYEIVN